MKTTRLLFLILAAALAVACGSTTTPEAATGSDAATDTAADSSVDGTTAADATDATEAGDVTDAADSADATDGADSSADSADASDATDAADSTDGLDATDGDHPPLDGPPASRSVTRLSTEQLRLSLITTFGTDAGGKPMAWSFQGKNGDIDALSDDGLAATLGKPDYVQVMAEDLSPSSLYVKLVDDMARDVCPKAIAADAGRAQADRVLTRFAGADEAAQAKNLRYLKLRFLGEASEDDDPVADLAAVYAAAASGADAEDSGWTAVCVALLTSPAFHLY